MHILIAPNAFKNSLTAHEAAKAIREGLERSRLVCSCTTFPIADGGDGTAALLTHRADGTLLSCNVQDPLGRKVDASWGLIDQGQTAVIEMAEASGMRLLAKEELNPLKASSFGTGEMILKALSNNVRRIIVSMGGSATVDAGTGILRALGVRFLSATGESILDLPEDLSRVARVDVSGLDPRILHTEIIVLSDVTNPLLGPAGSAQAFGPQKGATSEDLFILEASLMAFVDALPPDVRAYIGAMKYGGAAGGAAAGLHAILGAKLQSGADFFLKATDFDSALRRANLVITGEGSLDHQTLQGKGPLGVGLRAKMRGLPVVGLAGRIPKEVVPELREFFDVLLTIGAAGVELAEALKSTYADLRRTAEEVGNLLALV
ncbi:glycerate kinase [Arcticibacter sp. MXS-1]|uniref:glycerate kinase n=1 Tax=Arcticibacter sp. MXS-1 TaxID=3341726 RepID=UPI0035A88EDB